MRAPVHDHSTGESSAGSTLLCSRQCKSSSIASRQYASAATHGGHPFGTLKFWMGAVPLPDEDVAARQYRMSLHVLAYNLKAR